MQLIKIESEQITLPFEVFNELRGKQVRFVRYQDGFAMKPASESLRKGKLSKLKPRKLVNGNPDDLVDIKVGIWGEPENL